jgi:hypothetical protein
LVTHSQTLDLHEKITAPIFGITKQSTQRRRLWQRAQVFSTQLSTAAVDITKPHVAAMHRLPLPPFDQP